MPNITDLITATRELREIIKTTQPSAVSSDLRLFTLGVPGATSLRFSLPARCLWVGFQSSCISLFGAPISCASTQSGRILAIASSINVSVWQSGNASPFDFSDMIVWGGAEVSGVTLNAFVRSAAPVATS